MDMSFFFMVIGFVTSFILLYQRKKRWATNRTRWMLTGILAGFGLLGFLVTGMYAAVLGSQFLLIPFIYNCFDRLFKYITLKKYNRDFYLWLRYSSEIDDRMMGHNPHVGMLDKLFSVTLLFMIFGLLITGVLIYRFYKTTVF